MKTGRVWAGTIDDIPVQVVYTRHFADRFDKDEGDRPAVARYVDEPEILEVITDALPGITDKWRSIWDHSGIITSRGRDLNMSFVTETDNDGMTVVMKNMMLKHVYEPHPEDYVFAVAGFEMGDTSEKGGVRKAFFDYIRERRSVLERIKQEPLVNVVTAEHLWSFVQSVGNFLLEYGFITDKDLNVANGMAEDYEERLDAFFPRA